MPYCSVACLTLLMALLTGCIDPGKTGIETANRQIGNGINTSNWTLVAEQLADPCEVTYNGRTVPAANAAFVQLFKNIKERRGYSVDKLHINRFSATSYEATVTATLKTARATHTWEMTQHWTKVGEAMKMDKVGIGSSKAVESDGFAPPVPVASSSGTVATPPPAAPGNGNAGMRPGSPAGGFGIVSDVQAGADYATGATQLKAKKKISERISNIQNRQGARTGDKE